MWSCTRRPIKIIIPQPHHNQAHVTYVNIINLLRYIIVIINTKYNKYTRERPICGFANEIIQING